MIRLDERIEYVELYYTMQCNLRCSYCINGAVDRRRYAVDPGILAHAINGIEFGNIPLTIGGGEPTIGAGFDSFISALKPEIKIDLLTNGTWKPEQILSIPVKRFTDKGSTYKSIRISYHVGQEKEKLVSNAEILSNCGYRVGIFGIAHPENLRENMEMADLCSKAGVFFFVKEFLGEYLGDWYGRYKYPEGKDGILKTCECRSSEVLIDPCGDIFRCHSDLYGATNAQGNIVFYKGDSIGYDFRECTKFGICNPCDLKIKISPDLKRSRCSVEVRR
jgi:MoaA/NifB/PqqE/SkfB family radical SAM enzyme